MSVREILKPKIFLFEYLVAMKYLLLLLLFTSSVFSQSDWEKWGKKENPYLTVIKPNGRDYSLNNKSILDNSAKILIMGYWFFISDLDGDNCPFSPTCSSFFLQSVKETNLVQGALMFGDRFMRDANFIDRNTHYITIKDEHYFDPVYKYTFDRKKIIYFLEDKPVKPE